MIGVSTAIVAHNGPDIFRHIVQVANQVLNRFFLEIGLIFERVIYIRDVGLVMFGIMNFHRPRVDVRLERVVWVGQFR